MRRPSTSLEDLAPVLRPGRSVATHAELREAGVSMSTITRRISPAGIWQRALPGVVFGHRGTPTSYERRMAALAYAGRRGVLTGVDALAEAGVDTARRLTSARVHVLIPHEQHRTSHGFATITRCRHLPDPRMHRGLRCAPVPRALVDACRRLTGLDDVRTLVADVVQHHGVTAEQIKEELRRAARQRTALTRTILREIAAGLRSVAEAELRRLLISRGVPQPLWNAEVRLDDGSLVAEPDALWKDVWVVVELDSMEWHLSPAAYKRTQKRQRRLVVLGMEVIPVSPSEIRSDPDGLVRDILTKLRTTEPRHLPGLHVRSNTQR